MDGKFKTYQKTTITEIRPYEEGEKLPENINIGDYYLMHGSPKVGDMICRNRSNHDDIWLIDHAYFTRHYVCTGVSAIQAVLDPT
jgi:hypothetical protein